MRYSILFSSAFALSAMAQSAEFNDAVNKFIESVKSDALANPATIVSSGVVSGSGSSGETTLCVNGQLISGPEGAVCNGGGNTVVKGGDAGGNTISTVYNGTSGAPGKSTNVTGSSVTGAPGANGAPATSNSSATNSTSTTLATTTSTSSRPSATNNATNNATAPGDSGSGAPQLFAGAATMAAAVAVGMLAVFL